MHWSRWVVGWGLLAMWGCTPPPLPDGLRLVVDGPVTVAPGEESAPVRVRAVCPGCNVDWTPFEYVLQGPADGTPAQSGRFDPNYADWESFLIVRGNPDSPLRGEQPLHTVVLRRKGARVPGDRSVEVPVTITLTGGSFALVPSPTALQLTGGLGLITVEVQREAGFTEPVQVNFEAAEATVSDDAEGSAIAVEPLDGAPTDRARFLVRSLNAGIEEYRARFSAAAGNTRRVVTVAIDRASASPTPDALAVTTTPTSTALRPGASTTVAVTAQRLHGFAGAIEFAAAGLPPGVTATFAPPTALAGRGPASSTMTLTASAQAQPGIDRCSVVATSGARVAAYGFQLTILGPPRDAGPEEVFDGGDELDAGVEDAGLVDAGLVDAGLVDAGVASDGGSDAGVPAGPNRLRCSCGLAPLVFVDVCTSLSCNSFSQLGAECLSICGDAGSSSAPGCTEQATECVAPIDAGPPASTLLECECSGMGPRVSLCASVNCASGEPVVACEAACGDAGLFTFPSCTPQAPACLPDAGQPDAGQPLGTTLVDCLLEDAGIATVCSNVPCFTLQSAGRLAGACYGAFGNFFLTPTACRADAVACGGFGTSQFNNAIHCSCSDGRLVGVCRSFGICSSTVINQSICDTTCAPATTLFVSCNASSPDCPVGVTTFTNDAGPPDAGPDGGLDAGTDWNLVQLSAGWTHVCGLTDGGDVWCWGQNPRLTPTPATIPPTLVTGLPPATRLASGNGSTCALTVAGDVWCFGQNDSALNMNLQADGGVYGPRLVDAGMAFEHLVGGGSTLCGLNRDGGLFCWGGNLNGGLGRGFSSSEQRQPGAPDGGGPWRFVASGQQHTCALDLASRAFCWGLQPPISSLSAYPLDGGRTFSMISAGFQHTCGIEASTSLALCWGVNSTGQLGVPLTLGSSRVPVAVDGGFTFVAVTTGSGFSCGLDDGGVASCWGFNSQGQLGSSGGTFPFPWPVSGGLRFSSLSSGQAFTCGLSLDGRVYCWGSNSTGALGFLGGGSSSIPIEVQR